MIACVAHSTNPIKSLRNIVDLGAKKSPPIAHLVIFKADLYMGSPSTTKSLVSAMELRYGELLRRLGLNIALTLRREHRDRLRTGGQQGGAMPASNAREGPTIHVSNGAPHTSHMAIQPQQPVSLDYSLQPLTDNSGYTYEPPQALHPRQADPTGAPCSAPQSLETQATPPHVNSENNEPIHGKSNKRRKREGTSRAEPGRDMPSMSSTQFFCNHHDCRNETQRYGGLSPLHLHIWSHSTEKQRFDPNRTAPGVEGRAYGYINDGKEFAFVSVDALLYVT